MASSSGSDENLQQVMDRRKRRRMESNRESARRSRMRKQKHLDDLTAEVARLAKENNQILTAIGATKQHLVAVEAENSILGAQMMELAQRLKSLNEILDNMNPAPAAAAAAAAGGCMFEAEEFSHLGFGDGFCSGTWPIVASVDVFDY